MVGAPRPESGEGHRVGGQKMSAESNAELRGLDEDSLVIEHIQVRKAPTMY